MTQLLTPSTSRINELRANLRDTPGRMRLLAVLLVLLSLAAGITGAQAFATAQGALTRAQESSAQFVRAQTIATSLAQADAVATSTFLVGGLEPPEQRASYDQAVDRAVATLTAAARAQPADEAALTRLSVLIATYMGQVQSARANNRQGLPVGAEYLRQASAQLRTEALPLLAGVTAANAERAEQEFTLARVALVWVAITFPLELALAIFGLVWLARRTRRYLNVPVVAAQVIILVAFIGSLIVMSGISSTVADIKAGPYAQTQALAQARNAAFSAKSSESLALISRGSGQAFEKAWKDSAVEVESALDSANDRYSTELETSWAAYRGQHQEIVALDDQGLWDEAVARATAKTAKSSVSFRNFDEKTKLALTGNSEELTARLGAAGRGLTVATWLMFALGLVAAALIWQGLTRRIEEYR